MPTNEVLAGAVRDAVAPFSASPAVGADVTVRLANGGEVALKLSPADFAMAHVAPLAADAADEEEEAGLGPAEVPIVEVVRKAGEPLTREQIASKLTPKRNPKSGSFRRTLESLSSEEREVLVETADGKYGLHPDFQT